ncbi:MAG: hypothetical protein QW650_07430 [Thermofilum sp.]
MKRVAIYMLLLLAAVVAGIAGMRLVSFREEPRKIAELAVAGGFWGAREKYEYYSDGTISFKGRTGQGSFTVPHSIVEEMAKRVSFLLEVYPRGLRLEPGGGADYFTYNLTLHSGDFPVSYYWTDVGEQPPREITYLYQLLREVNLLASSRRGVVFYLKVDKLNFSKGETVRIVAVAVNPGEVDFKYLSPTPCTPDFKVQLRTPSGREVELFPVGYDPEKICVQVVQERVLKPGGVVQLEYEYVASESGTYTVEAHFPYAEWSETRHSSVLELLVP